MPEITEHDITDTADSGPRPEATGTVGNQHTEYHTADGSGAAFPVNAEVGDSEADISAGIAETSVGTVDPIRKGAPLILSRLISTVMSPLVMPLVAVMSLLFANTILGYIPPKIKLYYTLIILLNTCVVPILCIGLLHSTGVIRGLFLTDRRDRILPLMITAMCYVVCAFMVSGMFGAYLIKKLLLAGAACITLSFIVSFYWKISIHMLAAGGTLAMLLLIHVSGIGNFFGAVIAMIGGCGMLASARMYLDAHTPAQVAAGFFGGFFVATAVLLI